MEYNDEYHGTNSMAAYDGELIPLHDAVARYKRDEELQEKYVQAKQETDLNQMTWDQIERRLGDKE